MWNKLTRDGRKAMRAEETAGNGTNRDFESSKTIRRERDAARVL